MSNHKSPNTDFHHLFHLKFDIEMVEVGFFQLFRNLGKSMLTLALPFYLYTTLNYEIWQICFFYLVWEICFFVLHPFAGLFVGRIGLKHCMTLMTITSSIFWLSIPIILQGNFWTDILYMIPILLIRSFGYVLYEIAYDIFLTHHINREKPGKIIAYLQIAILMAALISPILGAYLTTQFGLDIASYVAAGFFIFSGLILLLTKDERVRVPYSPKKLAVDTIKNTPKALYISQAAWVFNDAILWVIWPLFLVLVVQDLMSMSLLIGISSLLSMIVAYFIGRKIDQSPKTSAAILNKASLTATGINLMRALTLSPVVAGFIDFFFKINWQSLTVPHDNEIYKWLHEKDTYERSHIRWWIIESLYLIPFAFFIPLFYFFPEGPQWLFICLFLIGGLGLLGMKQVAKLNEN